MFQSTADSDRLDQRIAEVANRPAGNSSPDGSTETSNSGTDASNVRLDGSLTLGDTDQPALTATQLATTASELIGENKQATVAALVATYPDIVHQVLTDPGSAALPGPERKVLAAHYQRRWGGDRAAMEKLAAIGTSSEDRAFLNARRQFRERLERNQPNEALDLKLGRLAGNDPWFVAEAGRLEGIAQLIAGQYTKAIGQFESSAMQLRKLESLEANRVLLLLGEVHRRAGNDSAWQQAWQTAVVDHSRRLARSRLKDPGFWRQAAFLKPFSADWPEEAVTHLKQDLVGQGLVFDEEALPESIVWASIGSQSLARHEAQNAILAFKKSEATVRDSELKQALQLRQAMAMIDAGQAGPASAILLRISSHPGTLGDRAKAIMGTLKLQTGSLAQGMNLLQAAIGSSGEWPVDERLRAHADYGLAYLMRGREAQGLQLLDQVHQQFLELGDYEQASQCLFNIATYFDKTDQPSQYRAAVKRLESFESTSPL